MNLTQPLLPSRYYPRLLRSWLGIERLFSSHTFGSALRSMHPTHRGQDAWSLASEGPLSFVHAIRFDEFTTTRTYMHSSTAVRDISSAFGGVWYAALYISSLG